MDTTIADLAVELNKRYSQFLEFKLSDFEKGEKGKIFIGILKNLFDIYGERLGYSDFSDFKRDVVVAKNNLRKNKFKKVKKPKTKKPNEGSGQIFTEYQIENLGLNPDSY